MLFLLFLVLIIYKIIKAADLNSYKSFILMICLLGCCCSMGTFAHDLAQGSSVDASVFVAVNRTIIQLNIKSPS